MRIKLILTHINFFTVSYYFVHQGSVATHAPNSYPQARYGGYNSSEVLDSVLSGRPYRCRDPCPLCCPHLPGHIVGCGDLRDPFF